jgi:thiamine pyrophosphate-dependent acetolactate synthase large subunit-like protein
MSYNNSILVGEVGISEASGYVMIGSSLDMVGALGCRLASRVTERIFSRINFPSLIVQCTMTPPEVISRYSADSVLRPCTKCCMNIASGIDNSRPDMASCLYRDQVAPKANDITTEIDDLGKKEECKAELIIQNDPIAMTTTDMELVPLFSPSH